MGHANGTQERAACGTERDLVCHPIIHQAAAGNVDLDLGTFSGELPDEIDGMSQAHGEFWPGVTPSISGCCAATSTRIWQCRRGRRLRSARFRVYAAIAAEPPLGLDAARFPPRDWRLCLRAPGTIADAGGGRPRTPDDFVISAGRDLRSQSASPASEPVLGRAVRAMTRDRTISRRSVGARVQRRWSWAAGRASIAASSRGGRSDGNVSSAAAKAYRLPGIRPTWYVWSYRDN